MLLGKAALLCTAGVQRNRYPRSVVYEDTWMGGGESRGIEDETPVTQRQYAEREGPKTSIGKKILVSLLIHVSEEIH